MTDNDLISRSALLERLAFKRMGSMQRNTYPGLESAIAQVKKAPAVDAEEVFKHLNWVKEALEMAKQTVAPVRHGRWLVDGRTGMSFCSECQDYAVEADTNYCPNCGAKMDGERE